MRFVLLFCLFLMLSLNVFSRKIPLAEIRDNYFVLVGVNENDLIDKMIYKNENPLGEIVVVRSGKIGLICYSDISADLDCYALLKETKVKADRMAETDKLKVNVPIVDPKLPEYITVLGFKFIKLDGIYILSKPIPFSRFNNYQDLLNYCNSFKGSSNYVCRIISMNQAKKNIEFILNNHHSDIFYISINNDGIGYFEVHANDLVFQKILVEKSYADNKELFYVYLVLEVK